MSLPGEAQLLEVRAAAQRQHLHESVGELREVIQHKLDVKARAREHMLPAGAVLAVAALALGYTLTGIVYDNL